MYFDINSSRKGMTLLARDVERCAAVVRTDLRPEAGRRLLRKTEGAGAPSVPEGSIAGVFDSG
jgi:hypothetical protein